MSVEKNDYLLPVNTVFELIKSLNYSGKYSNYHDVLLTLPTCIPSKLRCTNMPSACHGISDDEPWLVL